MKAIAKWIALLWSLFCLFGVVYGFIAFLQTIQHQQDSASNVGSAIGFGLGISFWALIWLVIAGPSLIIYLVSGSKPPPAASLDYYPPQGKKNCPVCAEEIQLAALKCKHCGTDFDPDQVAQYISRRQ